MADAEGYRRRAQLQRQKRVDAGEQRWSKASEFK